MMKIVLIPHNETARIRDIHAADIVIQQTDDGKWVIEKQRESIELIVGRSTHSGSSAVKDPPYTPEPLSLADHQMFGSGC
jgi:hypothetical protein